MDSFLDEPRSTPKPTPVIQEIGAPTVPEVSLMFQNPRKDKTPLPIDYNKPLQSYNAWKLRNHSNNNQEYDSFLLTNPSNKENAGYNLQPNQDKSFLSKKQVRFESPVQQNSPMMNYRISKQSTKKLPENVTEKNPIRNMENQNVFKLRYNPENYSISSNFQNNTIEPLNTKTQPIVTNYSPVNITNPPKTFSKPFEKVYISNIPNRELDLSFLEPQKNSCSSTRTPNFTSNKTINSSPIKTLNFTNNVETYSTLFNKINTVESINKINIPINPENNSSLSTKSQDCAIMELQEINKSEESKNGNSDCDNNKKQSTNESELKPTNDSVTVSDLLTIIKMQNEQLQLLQNQVEKLVKLSEKSEEEKSQKSIENTDKNHVLMYKDQQVGTSFKETNANDGQKISVGLMTSFEVSFKPPATKKTNRIRTSRPVQAESSNSSVFETTEYYEPHEKQKIVKRNKADFQQQDIMNHNYRRTNETEYSLGSQESLDIQEPPESPENSIHIDMQEYDTDSDDECSSDQGWTFYKDILGQVNNLLENSSRPTYKQDKNLTNRNHNQENYTDTTLERIKLTTMKRLQNEGFLQSSDDQCPIKPTEVSFALKQILMKYLPDDGLANVVNRNKQEYNKPEKRKPTDISVTAFKYTQQCNVVTNAPQYYGRKGKSSVKRPSKNKMCPSTTDPKILDITTLKQQPKFL